MLLRKDREALETVDRGEQDTRRPAAAVRAMQLGRGDDGGQPLRARMR
jgi:hypothetical protein